MSPLMFFLEANQVISHPTTKSLCVFVSNWCTLQENGEKEISTFPTAEGVAELLKKDKDHLHI